MIINMEKVLFISKILINMSAIGRIIKKIVNGVYYRSNGDYFEWYYMNK